MSEMEQFASFRSGANDTERLQKGGTVSSSALYAASV